MDIQGLSKHKDFLLKLKEVVGVGAGTKHTGGVDTGEPCVVAFVREKLPLEKLDTDQVVPQLLPDGTKTDVIEVGDVRILPLAAEATTEVENRLRHRPVMGGVSISPGNFPTTGTGGLIVLQGNTPCMLSNNHVIRLSQVDPEHRPQKGTPIRQPGMPDSGIWDGNYRGDDIGELWDWVEVTFPGPNEGDCAILRLFVPHIPYILGLGGPAEIAKDPSKLWSAETRTWAKVQKSGRASGITEGRVVAIDVTIQVNFGRGLLATFEGQIATTPILVAGDSGSVLITNDRVVGLGFAASTQMSFANPIGKVFELLNLTLPPPVAPIEDILPQLGEAIIWGFNNETKTWDSFNPAVPERFRHLRFLVPGNGYWIEVAKDLVLEHNGSVWKLWKGWNLIGWR